MADANDAITRARPALCGEGVNMGKKKQKAEAMPTEPERQTARERQRKGWKNIWALGTVLSLIGAYIMLTRYMDISEIYRTEPSVTDLYDVDICNRYSYVLYRDLYNAVNGRHLTFGQLFASSDEAEQELTLSEELFNQGQYILNEEAAESGAALEEVTEDTDPTVTDDEETDEEKIRRLWGWVMQESLDNINAYLEECLGDLSRKTQERMAPFDYWMQDQDTGFVITNTLQTEKGRDFSVEEYAVWFQIRYDAAGNYSVQGVLDNDANTLTKALYDSERKGLYETYVEESDVISYVPESLELPTGLPVYVGAAISDNVFISQLKQRARSYGGPQNCTVIYGIKSDQWDILVGNYYGEHDYRDIFTEYRHDGLGSIYLAIVAALLCGGFFYGNPRSEEKRLRRHFYHAPAEAVIVGVILVGNMQREILSWATRLYLNNNPYYHRRLVTYWTWGDVLNYGLNLLVAAGLFFAAWYAGCCLGETRWLGVRGYLRRRMICSQVFNWCRERVSRYYQTLVNLDITRDSRRQVIKLLVINGIVVLLLCTMWVAGWFGVIIYSLLLYFVVKKYISDLQKKYSILLRATNEIADGNLEVRITEHLGVFEPFKPQIYRIEEGFQKAVEEEVKSQRMKTELITNVSHDLKTPLTAIITYVNLLKEENVTEEQRIQYLQILEQKSLRLKALIEDLFEISKANSKSVTLSLVDVDIVNLLRQVEFEQEDRLTERNLAVRLRLPEEKVIVRLDSQKAYRIYENLFGNIIKYAMEGTRIYVDLEQTEGEVTVRLKNITEQEITVSAEELTERFVRGDASRNTEGSGLGLAIVRSFTELMGGRFEVTVDGDLFTASTTWAREQRQIPH